MADDSESEQDQGANLTEISPAPYKPNAEIPKLEGQKTADPPVCPECGHKARCRKKLEAHILEHSDNPLVVCIQDGCEMLFNLHQMFHHEKTFHSECSSLICVKCNEAFETQSMLTQHYKFHIKRKDKIKCDMCDFEHRYPGQMDRHKQEVHGVTIIKQFTCDFKGCKYICNNRGLLYAHSRTHTHREYKCTQCDKVYQQKGHLACHMASHQPNPKRYLCTVAGCKRSYKRKDGLAKHMKQNHTSSIEPKTMPSTAEENSGSDTTGGAEEQQDLNGETTTAKCEKCSINFRSLKDFISHLEQHHRAGEYTIVPKSCGFSNCKFATHFRAILSDHQKTMHGGRFLCKICGRVFKDQAHFNQHRITHLNIELNCTYEGCKEAFKDQLTFNTHILSHSNEQPLYRCPNCKYITSSKKNLNFHQSKHSNDRKFKCPYDGCEREFKRNGCLTAHLTHDHQGVKRAQRNVYPATVQFRCDKVNCHFETTEQESWELHRSEHETDWEEKYQPKENKERKKKTATASKPTNKRKLAPQKKAVPVKEEDIDDDEEAFAKKPTKKIKTTMVIASDSVSVDSDIDSVASLQSSTTGRPGRSVRQRKPVNYKAALDSDSELSGSEPSEQSTIDDGDSDDIYEFKKPTKKATKKAKF